jgi:hypothetical protein
MSGPTGNERETRYPLGAGHVPLKGVGLYRDGVEGEAKRHHLLLGTHCIGHGMCAFDVGYDTQYTLV